MQANHLAKYQSDYRSSSHPPIFNIILSEIVERRKARSWDRPQTSTLPQLFSIEVSWTSFRFSLGMQTTFSDGFSPFAGLLELILISLGMRMTSPRHYEALLLNSLRMSRRDVVVSCQQAWFSALFFGALWAFFKLIFWFSLKTLVWL